MALTVEELRRLDEEDELRELQRVEGLETLEEAADPGPSVEELRRLDAEDEARAFTRGWAGGFGLEEGIVGSGEGGEFTVDELQQLDRLDALKQDYVDWERLREEHKYAAEDAAYAQDPAKKWEAYSKAKYLEDRMVGLVPSGEDINYFLETRGDLPGHMPGEKTPFYKGVDWVDMSTSPISRPAFSKMRADADIDYMIGMEPDDRKEWLENLHLDDPRRDVMWNIHESIEAAGDKKSPYLTGDKSFMANAILLAGLYQTPNAADPYGYGVASPWQQIAPGGQIIGGGGATSMDILARYNRARINQSLEESFNELPLLGHTRLPGGPMDILDPSYWEGLGMSAMAGWDRESVLSAVHESRSKDYLFPVGEGWKPEGFDEAMAQVGEQYGSPMEMARIGPHLAGLGVETGFRVAGSMWPAFLGGDRSPGDVWAEKKGQFADVWSGEADPSVGSIWPTLFATIGPDLLVPVSGIAKAPSAAHKLTRSGVRSLDAASTAAGKRLLLDAEKLAGSSGLSDEAVGYILDMTRNHTETAFDVIGGKAQLGLRVDEVMDVAGGTTKVVEDVGEAGRVLGVSDMAAMGRAEAAAARDAVAYARRGKVPLTADEAVEEVVLSFGRPGKPKLGPRVKPGFTEAGARTPLVPVHINLDEALTVTKGGGGRYVVNFHPEKADVLYASDRAARAATEKAVRAKLTKSGEKQVDGALASWSKKTGQAAGKVPEARLFAELADSGVGLKVALAGALIGGGAGYFSAPDDPELTSKWKRAWVGMAAGAGVFGGVRQIPNVLDRTGRGVAHVSFKAGFGNPIRYAEGFRKRMPIFKNMKPWATNIGSEGAENWVPLTLKDAMGITAWERFRWLNRKRGWAEAKMLSEAEDAIGKAFSGWGGGVSSAERKILTDLLEVMGHASKSADDAMELMEALTAHVGRVLNYTSRSPRGAVPTMARARRTAAGKTEGEKVVAGQKARRAVGRRARLDKQTQAAADSLRRVLNMSAENPNWKLLEEGTAYDTVTDALRKADAVRALLRQVLGAADPAELNALRKLTRDFDHMTSKLRSSWQEPSFKTDLLLLTPAEARNAARMWRDGVRGLDDPAFAQLSKKAQRAFTAIRSFFDDMYERLVAHGAFGPGGRTRQQFLEEMGLGGYVHHMFSKRGIKAVDEFKEMLARDFGGVDVDSILPAAMKRAMAGSVKHANASFRNELALMGLNAERMKAGGRAFDDVESAMKELGEGAFAEFRKAHGLDDVMYFEADAAKIMTRYSSKVNRWASNMRWLQTIKEMFPEGERLAGLAARRGKDPATGLSWRVVADQRASELGFRRVDGVRYLRSVFGGEHTAVFAKHADEIREVLREVDPSVRGAALQKLLIKLGLNLDDAIVEGGQKLLARDLYLPTVYADTLEYLGKNTLRDWANKSPAFEQVLGSYDAVTNLFKVATTLWAPAFHGRNFISNVVTNLMTHGVAAVAPSNQIDALYIMRGGDEMPYTLSVRDPKTGDTTEITKTVGAWKDEMRLNGVVMDNLDLSDQVKSTGRSSHLRYSLLERAAEDGSLPMVESAAARRRVALFGRGMEGVRLRTPAYVGGSGAALGGVAGFAMSEPEDRLAGTFIGMYLGGISGAGVGGITEMFVKDPVAAARFAVGRAEAAKKGMVYNPETMAIGFSQYRANAKLAMSAAFDEWIDIVGGTKANGFSGAITSSLAALAKSDTGRVGSVGGGVGVLAGEFVSTADEDKHLNALKWGMAGALGLGGLRALGDPAFVIAGGVGRKIEEQAKIVNYLAGLKKGLSSDEAAKLVHKTLFDYNDLTPFERHILRRIFPFYTWSSKNATELQPFLLAERPLSYSVLSKILDAADGGFSSKQDVNMLQDHMRYRVVLNAGLGRIIAGIGLPMEDGMELLKFRESELTGAKIVPTGLIGRMHPGIILLYKFLSGTDPYYNVELDRVRSGRDVRFLPPWIQRWVGYAEIEDVDSDGNKFIRYEVGHFPTKSGRPGQGAHIGARRLALLRAYPAWRIAAEWTKLVTDTFMTGVRGESGVEATGVERFFALTTGTKPYAVDWDRLERWAYHEFDERLGKELMRDRKKIDISVLLKTPYNREETQMLIDMGMIEEPEDWYP